MAELEECGGDAGRGEDSDKMVGDGLAFEAELVCLGGVGFGVEAEGSGFGFGLIVGKG